MTNIYGLNDESKFFTGNISGMAGAPDPAPFYITRFYIVCPLYKLKILNWYELLNKIINHLFSCSHIKDFITLSL